MSDRDIEREAGDHPSLMYTNENTDFRVHFDQYLDKRFIAFERSMHWSTTATEIPSAIEGFTVVHKGSRDDGFTEVLFTSVDHWAAIEVQHSQNRGVWFRIGANHEEQITALGKMLLKHFPSTPESPNKVHVGFWFYSPSGPREQTRSLSVTPWTEIRSNYAPGVVQELDRWMFKDFQPASSGNLVLWRGEPGTGKTWAIRSLMSAWHDKAKFSYITDPDHFFGDNSDYMMRVLLKDEFGDDENQLNVLVLEDCGELITYDAKQRTGQALSRLLNVVDGLIGQGLKVIVLITTNEDISKLHPAVSRAGRCALNLEFGPLPKDKAIQWLSDHGAAETAVTSPTKLCDLYAHLNGVAIPALITTGFKS